MKSWLAEAKGYISAEGSLVRSRRDNVRDQNKYAAPRHSLFSQSMLLCKAAGRVVARRIGTTIAKQFVCSNASCTVDIKSTVSLQSTCCR